MGRINNASVVMDVTAATLDAHLEDMRQLAGEIDASRAEFNAEMLRLLTPRANEGCVSNG
jgi:hypothetical protein